MIVDVVGKADANGTEGLEHNRSQIRKDAAGRSGSERETQPDVDGPLPFEPVVRGELWDQTSMIGNRV